MSSERLHLAWSLLPIHLVIWQTESKIVPTILSSGIYTLLKFLLLECRKNLWLDQIKYSKGDGESFA